MQARERCFYSGIIGIISLLLTLYIRISGADNKDSLKDYIVAILVFMGMTLFSYIMLSQFRRKITLPKIVGKILVITLILGEVMLLRGIIDDDNGYSGADVSGFFWHILPRTCVCALVCLTTFFGTNVFIKTRNFSEIGWCMKIYFLIMAFLYACTVVFINVFAADVYHINAFLHPIYSIYYNTPYSDVSYGIYGHYELFYKLPMMIFGTSPVVICVVLFLAAMLCALFAFYVICSITRTNFVRILSALILMVPTGAMFQSSSYQTTPHRVFFPLMIVAYACFINNRMKASRVPNKKEFLIGHAICSLAVLSNTELGLVVILAWAFVNAIWSLQLPMTSLVGEIKRFAIIIASAIMDIVVALIIINIYNLFVGGNLYFKEFFSTFTNDSFLDHYIITIQFRNVPYIYIMIAGCASIVFSLSKTRFFQKRCDQKNAAIVGMVGVLAIGSLAYYVVRAAYYGILIAVPFTIVLCAFFADSLYNTFHEVKAKKGYNVYLALRTSVGVFCLGTMCSLAIMGTTLPSCFSAAYEKGKYTIKGLKDQTKTIVEEIPRNTYALGWGTDEIYGILGWNTGYHLLGTTDVLLDPDANIDVFKILDETVNNEDAVFINYDNYHHRQIFNIDHRLEKEIVYQNNTYGYFVKDAYNPLEKIDIQDFDCKTIDDLSCDIYMLARDYYSILIKANETDLSQFKIVIQYKNTDKIFLTDSNIVSYIDNGSRSNRIYTRIDVKEINYEKHKYQVLLYDPNNNILYQTGIELL